MMQALRKTPSHLQLTYKYGEGSDRLIGRNFFLLDDAAVLTLAIDLASNFQTRNKTSTSYMDALNLLQNHHKLQSIQCGDNLVRSRLIRAWEQVAQPQLRMCLDLGQRGRYLYAVQPHSLFTGGIQLDVEQELPQEETRVSRTLSPQPMDHPRNHP